MGVARRRLERYFNRLWYDGRVPGAGWRALSNVYRLIAATNPADMKRRSSRPVIVVGNITVGGGGKTPVVAALAEALSGAGYRPAIISRGYGSRSGRAPRQVLPKSDPALCGDEPLMLARMSGCPVWVCPRRAAALEAGLAHGADVVISDDGLQHRALARSFEICVIDAARGLGNGHLLPAGPLRQPVERLDAVDLVLCKHSSGTIEHEECPGRPFQMVVEGLQDLGGGPLYSIDTLAGRTVDAVCGIANPESFFSTLVDLGLSIRRHAFPDHHVYRVSDLAHLSGPVVVTDKDAVKLERLDPLPETRVLRVRAQLPDDVISRVLDHVEGFESP